MPHRSKNAGPANSHFIPRGPGGEKHCSRCKDLRPMTMFIRDASRFDGRGYICSACRYARRKAAGPSIIDRRSKAGEGYRWCRGCEAWLAAGDVVGGACRPCLNRESRMHYRADDAFRARRSRRGAARRRGVEPVPPIGAEILMEEFEGACAYCPAPATTWDHVVAVAKGGLTEPANIVPCCGRCNSSKRTQDVWAWLDRHGREPKIELLSRLSLAFDSPFAPVGPTAL